ncbi:MAG: S-layer protein [Anaerospora sp.]|nr:S-layer protein [Anaerospora sp.]
MKKKIAAALAVTFALGVTSAFAANPFVDVPAKHWAYDAVSKLAQAGIVDGYGDGTFRGDKNITRYEMAQILPA